MKLIITAGLGAIVGGLLVSQLPHTGKTTPAQVSSFPLDVEAVTAPSNRVIGPWFSPRGGCQEEIVRAISEASNSIAVLAYEFTSEPIIQALVDAKKRGVKVRIVMDEKAATGPGDRREILKTAKIPVRLDGEHKIQHNKVIVIDENVVLTGSYNFSKSAEYSNAENLVRLEGKSIAEAYLEDFEAHWKHASPVALFRLMTTEEVSESGPEHVPRSPYESRCQEEVHPRIEHNSRRCYGTVREVRLV